MTEDHAVSLALDLLKQGRCTDNALIKQGVPLRMAYPAIRKAEARFVNEAMRLFPPPIRIEYDQMEQSR